MKHWLSMTMVSLLGVNVAEAQSLGSTQALAPLAGQLATPAPGQANIGVYATDLGYTFTHQGSLRILFGDTWADGNGNTVNLLSDDTQGSFSLASFPNGDAVDAYVAAHPPAPGKPSWQAGGPPITFRTNILGKVSPDTVLRDGAVLNMAAFRAPTAGFSNATDAAFAIFDRNVFTECSGGLNPSCDPGLTCDRGMGSCFGFSGENDLACVLGTTRCLCLPVPGGGMCQDRTSSFYDTTEDGRVLSIALRTEVGNGNTLVPEVYAVRSFFTNKFINPAVRTVNDFDPLRPNGSGNDYRPADGALPTANEKVFLWGRPDFVGMRNLNPKLYFAYVDMPHYDTTGHIPWAPKYFAGMQANGVPRFSSLPSEAVPLDLNGGADATHERYDIVNQMSVSYVPTLNKWVMLYGGDLPADVLSFFLGPNAGTAVRDPEGAIHVRFASQPWGPWSAPVQVFKGGDPSVTPPVPGSQYASGGILFHPGCTTNCAPNDPSNTAREPGRLYGANIIDAWTTPRGSNAVDLYWNVSSTVPYGVVLMRTRINGTP